MRKHASVAPKIFVITGPSGVGKGTMIRESAAPDSRARAVGIGDHAPAPNRRA